MRISIILGLVALIVGIVLFFLTFVVFEDGRVNNIKNTPQDVCIILLFLCGSILFVCLVINIPTAYHFFRDLIGNVLR